MVGMLPEGTFGGAASVSPNGGNSKLAGWKPRLREAAAKSPRAVLQVGCQWGYSMLGPGGKQQMDQVNVALRLFAENAHSNSKACWPRHDWRPPSRGPVFAWSAAWHSLCLHIINAAPVPKS